MTKVKDTKLTLAVIPISVGLNNSLIFLVLQTHGKKVAEFPFLLRNTIPWLTKRFKLGLSSHVRK